jgi:hypothetical protein
MWEKVSWRNEVGSYVDFDLFFNWESTWLVTTINIHVSFHPYLHDFAKSAEIGPLQSIETLRPWHQWSIPRCWGCDVNCSFNLYLHFVLFRTIYYYLVAVGVMRPYFRRHVTLIVNTTSQYKSTPRRTVKSFVCVNALPLIYSIATHPED